MMAIIKDELKAQELALRIYNSKHETKELQLEDEKAIKALCSAIFPESGESASQHELTKFNNIVVKTATAISEADIQQLINYFAEVQNVNYNTDMVKYTKAVPKHIKFKWAAAGSAVSLKRVETGKEQYIEIGTVQTGMSYNPLSNTQSQVDDFRALVRDVAASRVKLVYDTIMSLIAAGVAAGTVIPTKQCVAKAGVTMPEFDKVASIVGRRTGSRPLFVADRELITSFAGKKATVVTTNMPDALKTDLYDYELTNLGSADAVPLLNEFTTETGYDTQFPITTGYMFGSASGKKPFSVALAGGLTQKTEEDVEYGRIKMIVRQRLGVDFLYAQNIGVITDTAIVM